MTKYLDEDFFRLKRNKEESMTAWALREETVYLQMTRALARLEQTVDSTEPDWNELYKSQQNGRRWNNGSGALANGIKGRDTYESVDGDGDTAQDAHSWSDREERDGYGVRMQEMGSESHIFSHGQSTKDFLPDVFPWLACAAEVKTFRVQQDERCWQGLRTRWVDRGSWKLSNKKWPDHELLVYVGDR